MAYNVWIHRLSFNLSREIRWRLAAPLTFSLFFGAVIQVSCAAANSQFMSAPERKQSFITARRKFDEGEALRAQGTAESLGLAVKKYEESLQLWRAVGERRVEAITLNNIGFVYHSLGEKRKALDFYTQALPLFRAVSDRSEEAKTLNNISLAYYSLGEKKKAIDYYIRALLIYRAVGDRSGEGATLNNIGEVYDSMGKKRKALDYYKQASMIQRAIGGPRN
jgi:tetratricopeptide (TPR) repeat protein